jgi:hypothetical protein
MILSFRAASRGERPGDGQDVPCVAPKVKSFVNNICEIWVFGGKVHVN